MGDADRGGQWVEDLAVDGYESTGHRRYFESKGGCVGYGVVRADSWCGRAVTLECGPYGAHALPETSVDTNSTRNAAKRYPPNWCRPNWWIQRALHLTHNAYPPISVSTEESVLNVLRPM